MATNQNTEATRSEEIRKVSIKLTNGMNGATQVLSATFSPSEKTHSVAAKELIDSVVLCDGDTIEVSFS